MLGEVVAGQPDVPQLHRTVGTVRKQMDGIKVFAAFEVVSHLLQAVLGRIKKYHFGVGRQTFEQLPGIIHLAVNEHHVVALAALLLARSRTRRRWDFAALAIGGAVLGRISSGLRHGILGDHTHGRIEHDSRLQSHQQRSLAGVSWRLDGLAREPFDELHDAPPGGHRTACSGKAIKKKAMPRGIAYCCCWLRLGKVPCVDNRWV
ncbi:hypothetical protein D3C77_518060 [compost metagenome]